MAIQNTFYLDVDIKRDNYVDEPKVTQNDAVTFVLRMTDDGVDYPLAGVSTYTLASLRPDNQSVLTVGTLTAPNEITFELGSTEVSVPGNVKAAIQLYDVDGRVSSIPFTYEVTKDLVEGYIPSKDEQTLIELVLGQGPTILTAAQTATITANDAAANANAKAALANAEAQDANSAGIYARDKGLLAEQKAALADASANEADTATYNAENATQEAQDATNAINAVLPNVEGLENRGEYNSATTYVKNNLVERNGSSWQALQDTVGNSPPTLPTKSNAYWTLISQRGVDGMGAVSTVNGEGPDVNGNVSIMIPDPDLSGLATKAELGVLDDALTTRLEDISVNVKDFGAFGDGITDDTIAIQSAVDYVESLGGGKVIIPNGVYMILANNPNTTTTNFLKDEGGIALKSNVHLLLSEGCTLKAIPTKQNQYQIIRIFNKSNIIVEGGNIVGERTGHIGTDGEWGYGVGLTAARNITIRNVKISDCWGDGINLQYENTYGTCENIMIENSTIDNNRRQGMSIETGKNINIINCIFSNTNGRDPQAGIDIEPTYTVIPCENILIERCEFINNNQHILVHNARDNVKIINCNFDGSTTVGINVNENIKDLLIQSCSFISKGITMYPHSSTEYGNSLITNNIFKNLDVAISLNRNSEFINNKIFCIPTINAIELLERNIIISNNVISNGQSALTGFDSDISGAVIVNNYIENVENGISFSFTIHTEDISILNNTIFNCKNSGLSVRGLKNSVIKGNLISSKVLPSTDKYGINLTSRNDSITVENNIVRATGTIKFLKAIVATNWSDNFSIKVYFNNVKGSTTDAVSEIELTGVTGELLYNIAT